MNDIVDSQLIELEWRMEVWFIGHRRVTQAHLLTLIRPKSKELALRGECESVTITTTDLSHNIFEVLYTSWLFDHGLTAEHPVSQAELSLTIVSKCVKLANLGEQGRIQITALDL